MLSGEFGVYAMNEMIGENGWRIKKIGDISSINPDSISMSTLSDLVIKYIDIESVKPGKILAYTDFEFKNAPSRARRIVKIGDIIVSTVRPYLRAFAYVTNEYDNCICSTGFVVLRTYEEYSANYLYQYVLSEQFMGQILPLMVGSNYPAINNKDVANIMIHIPKSKKEQQKIAEILTTVDNNIEKTEALIEKYKNIKQGMMQDLLTKGIDEHGNIRSEETQAFKDSPIGRVPKEWEIVSFTRAIDYIEGGGTPSRFKEEYYLGNIPWATVKDFDGKLYKEDTLEHISLEALKKSSTRLIVEKRLIIATRMGLGRAFINIVPMAINQDVKAITINENFRIEFVLYWYLSIADVVERMGVGSTVKGISLKDLKNIIMVKPSIQEQDLIVNKIKQINVVIENEQKYFESLQQLKQGLMKDLLTGKVRVPLEEATG